jgi:hypothetical protein
MTTPTSGEISIQDIVDEFGGAAPHALSEYYGAASGVPTSGEITLSDFYGVSAFTMPSGIIIPYHGSSAPSGWTAFTGTNNRLVVGAGTSYNAGATGGSSTVNASASFTNTGGHTGGGSPAGNSNANSGRDTAGAHSHTATITASNVFPPYKTHYFIKASGDKSSIPAGGVMLGVSTITGSGVAVTDSGINSALYGGAYGTTGGANTHTISGTTTSAGGHRHITSGTGGGIQSFTLFANTSGAHTHASTGTLTIELKKVYLSAWTNASSAFTFEGAGIAMWESATPPAGWAICNGLNGTPDLRDYFVFIGSTANHGTKTNTTSANWNSSASNTVNHSHAANSSEASGNVSTGRHNSYSWTHTHTASGSASWTPPYYGLYFIQYTG